MTRSKNEDQVKKASRIDKRTLVLLVAIIIAIYVFLPQVDKFKGTSEALKNADFPTILIGFVFSFGTVLCAAFVYKTISLQPLKYLRTLLVQMASSFTNRLLPYGIGGLATNTRYLMKHDHTKVQAVSTAGLNNLIGVIGNTIILILIIILSKAPLNQVVKVQIPPALVIIVAVTSVGFLITLIVWKSMREKLFRVMRHIANDFQILIKRPREMTVAVIFSMFATSLYVLTLWASANALGVELSLIQIFFVFCIGVLSATLTPTPGGVGGAEAGLTAAFVSVGVYADLGLAIALVYRFLTYWLPIIPGFIAFNYVLRKQII